jgi:hypothetical protein
MWTRKGTILLASGISLILIGMMISNFQFIIIGLTFIAFLSQPITFTKAIKLWSI